MAECYTMQVAQGLPRNAGLIIKKAIRDDDIDILTNLLDHSSQAFALSNASMGGLWHLLPHVMTPSSLNSN